MTTVATDLVYTEQPGDPFTDPHSGRALSLDGEQP